MTFLTSSSFQRYGLSANQGVIPGLSDHLLSIQFMMHVSQVVQRVCNGNVSVGFLQYNKHLFVHIGHANHSYSDPLLESVDIRQIYDKFPEKKGGLKELFGKGPQNAFFLVKFWVSKTLQWFQWLLSEWSSPMWVWSSTAGRGCTWLHVHLHLQDCRGSWLAPVCRPHAGLVPCCFCQTARGGWPLWASELTHAMTRGFPDGWNQDGKHGPLDPLSLTSHFIKQSNL